jgi:polyferredoxin
MLSNLLDIPILGALLRSTWSWRLLRLTMLILLLVMIALGWRQHAIPGVAVRDPLMYTSFTTATLWVVWMMGMVPVAMLFGRSWCTVCPVGWLNGVASRLGLRRELPVWLNTFIPVTLVLLLLQLLVYFFAIHRFPDYSAVLLTWMVVLALLIGLIFRRRAFCLLLCPAGALFNLYARIAPWQLRVRSTETCAGCAAKPCISTRPSWREAVLGNLKLTWRSRPEGCPVDLVPAELSDSADCTLCMNCVQTCCNDNLKLGFRAWPGDLRSAGLPPSVTAFFIVLLGLLTANFTKVNVDLREAIFWLPQQLALTLGWAETGFYPLAVAWVGFLLPLLLLLPGLIVYFVGQIRVATVDAPQPAAATAAADGSIIGAALATAGRLALAVLPLVLSAHLVLALVKLNAKLGYLTLALQDTSGIKSYLSINVMRTIAPPGVIIPLDLLKWLIVVVLAIGMIVSLLAAKIVATPPEGGGRTQRSFVAAAVVTLLVLSSFYGSTVLVWLFVR